MNSAPLPTAATIAVAVFGQTDASDTLTGRIGLKSRIDLLVDRRDPAIQIAHKVPQLGKRLPRHHRQPIGHIG